MVPPGTRQPIEKRGWDGSRRTVVILQHEVANLTDGVQSGAGKADDGSGQAGQSVQHQASGDGDVQTCADAAHGYLDALISQIDHAVRDAVVFVTQQHDGWPPRRLEPWQGNCALGELDGDYAPSLTVHGPDPRVLVEYAMQARPATAQRVALVDGVAIVRRVGHCQAGAYGVARTLQGAQVRIVGNPQGGNDEMSPASVLGSAATAAQVGGRGDAPAHAGRASPIGQEVKEFIHGRHSAAAPVHRRRKC